MKKNNPSIFRNSLLFIAVTFFLASCTQEPSALKLNFKVRLTTWYRVSPANPVPVVLNGVTYVSLANLAVGGDGNATSMGDVKSYANSLAFGSDPKGPSLGAIGAPVTDIPGYPVLGGPLPLIQKGDFAGLPAVIKAFHIPEYVLGNTISLVLYNKKGDALFLSNVPGTGTSTAMSTTAGGYTNKTPIVGGAGKFKNYARGLAFARENDFAQANMELLQLQEKMTNDQLKAEAPSYANEGIAGARVAEKILQGVIAEEQNELIQSIDIYKKL